MTFAEECAAARAEIYASRAAIREREMAKPIKLLIREVLGDKQRRTVERQEAARLAWGSPPTGGLSRPGPRPGPRNRNARLT